MNWTEIGGHLVQQCAAFGWTKTSPTACLVGCGSICAAQTPGFQALRKPAHVRGRSKPRPKSPVGELTGKSRWPSIGWISLDPIIPGQASSKGIVPNQSFLKLWDLRQSVAVVNGYEYETVELAKLNRSMTWLIFVEFKPTPVPALW